MPAQKIGIFSRHQLIPDSLASQIRSLGFEVEVHHAFEAFQPEVFQVVIADFHGEPDIRVFNRILGRKLKVGTIVFSHLKGTKLLQVLFDFEVNASLSPTSTLESIQRAVEAALKGESFFDEQMLTFILSDKYRNIYDRIVSISPREWEIIDGIMDDLTNEEIAERFGLSVRTVNAHKRNILQKLQVRSLVGVTRMMLDYTTRYD
jgi:DNA-binding NarL/FixJ family response regulator